MSDEQNRYGITITFTDAKAPVTVWYATEHERDREAGRAWDRYENVRNVKDEHR